MCAPNKTITATYIRQVIYTDPITGYKCDNYRDTLLKRALWIRNRLGELISILPILAPEAGLWEEFSYLYRTLRETTMILSAETTKEGIDI